MLRKLCIGILIFSIAWWVLPDFVLGPIDDLIAFLVSVIDGICLIATRAKAAQDAVALISPKSTTQSR